MASESHLLPTDAGRWRIRLFSLAILISAAAAYWDSWKCPFELDDAASIAENPSIRVLWPPWAALHPPSGGLTVSGRPLLNYSLAVNYALGGTHVGGYHAVNLLIHGLAGLALFGIVRRALWIRPVGANSCSLQKDSHGSILAFVVALLWTLHPLQTESVAYVIQRAESLMGLLYLLTLYGFIRAVATEAGPGSDDPPAARTRRARSAWLGLSCAACFLGMATKEVMVSAPITVFVFDATFVSRSWAAAWRRRRKYYVLLASTWILLVCLLRANPGRGGTAGFGGTLGWGSYALTQGPAIVRYLRLALWPHPLIFDYGPAIHWIRHPGEAVPQCVAILALAGLAAAGLARRTAAGFLGYCFFAILSPTSLVAGGRQAIAEHRVYLALAPLLVAIAITAFRWAQARRFVPAALVLALVAAGALGIATRLRIETYRTDLALWLDTASHAPENPFAHLGLGNALFDLGRSEEARSEFETALRLYPDFGEAHANLANALARLGSGPEAMDHFAAALRLRPQDPRIHNNLGSLLAGHGQWDRARREFEAALALRDDFVEAHNNLGLVLEEEGLFGEASHEFLRAVQLEPGLAAAHNNYANSLRQLGRLGEAAHEYDEALRIDPSNDDALANLASLQAHP